VAGVVIKDAVPAPVLCIEYVPEKVNVQEYVGKYTVSAPPLTCPAPSRMRVPMPPFWM
jgi:hypothetical protein